MLCLLIFSTCDVDDITLLTAYTASPHTRLDKATIFNKYTAAVVLDPYSRLCVLIGASNYRDRGSSSSLIFLSIPNLVALGLL